MAQIRIAAVAALAACIPAATSQSPAASSQSDVWNSTFSLTQEQIDAAGLDNTTVNNVNLAARFERTNWAGNSVLTDPFYAPPGNSSHLPPGSLLSVGYNTNTSLYTLPTSVALTRILYQSETIDGLSVPASAFVLWPYFPREDPHCPGKFPVVGWAHGTSGCLGECAPSHIRNLWYQYAAPYNLALQGYVVVAPDYAGLGVTHYPNGTEIKHLWLSGPSQANDLFHSITAAQSAFPQLSENFVLLGHSQGGAATWSAAQRQVQRPVKGYLGAISVSPPTNPIRQLQTSQALGPLFAFLMVNGLGSLYPTFNPLVFLTEKGLRILKLLQEVRGCGNVQTVLLSLPDVVNSNLINGTWFRRFADLTTNGGKPVAGPLLLIQGTTDQLVKVEATDIGVNDTCTAYPDSDLEYVVLNGTDHSPTMFASQQIWLDWIGDRFAGRKAGKPCSRKYLSPALPVANYQPQLNYFMELQTQSYQIG